LDDHSTDNTRDVVRSVAREAHIELREWHQQQHQGVPGAFFQLLECVRADIYLFCDQDDIWQPGKIDATVANLLPEVASTVLCFSDPLVFKSDEPNVLYRLSEVLGAKPTVALQESRLFMAAVPHGHTLGFTRPLRDTFMLHRDVAHKYAIMHDVWMYCIAVASGTSRLISNVPTTLYRWHVSNVSGAFSGWRGKGLGRVVISRQQQHRLRRALSLHAKGFILASETLPCGPKLERLLESAKVVAKLDQWHSPSDLVRLLHGGVMWPNRRLALELAAACLWSTAKG
jgi:glycosyltransferase involved in cell wall biosynthesis